MREVILALLTRVQERSDSHRALQAALPHLAAMAQRVAGGTVDIAELLPIAQKLSRSLLFEYDVLREPLGGALLDLCNTIFLRDALVRCICTCQSYLHDHTEYRNLYELLEHLEQLHRIVIRDVIPYTRSFLAFDRIIWRLVADAQYRLPVQLDGEEWTDLGLAMSGLVARFETA